MKVNKDEVYVINQPKKSILSIVLVEKNEYPLPSEIHDRLFKLSEMSDLFFIFHETGSNGINPDKFCNLYSACSWIVSGGKLVDTYLRTIDYETNIFKSHTSIVTFDSIFEIPELDTLCAKIENLNMAGVEGPIMKFRRLSSDEIFKIYNEPEGPIRLINQKDTNDKKYSIWTSDSKAIFLRPSALGNIGSLDKTYKDSFTWTDIRYFLASAIKKLMISSIDSEIIDVQYGSKGEEQ